MRNRNSDTLEAQIELANYKVMAAGMHDIAALPVAFTELADLLKIQLCEEGATDEV